MKLLAIANIYNGKATIGFRLLDIDSKQTKDVPVESVKQVILSGKATIENLKLEKGTVIGSNGSIDRLPKLINGQLVGKSPLIILSQLGDTGYKISDFKGTISNIRTGEVIHYAKQNGISNGKIITKNGRQFISAISGNFIAEEIISKTKEKETVKTLEAKMTLLQQRKPESTERIQNISIYKLNNSFIAIDLESKKKVNCQDIHIKLAKIILDHTGEMTIAMFEKIASTSIQNTRKLIINGELEELAIKMIEHYNFTSLVEAARLQFRAYAPHIDIDNYRCDDRLLEYIMRNKYDANMIYHNHWDHLDATDEKDVKIFIDLMELDKEISRSDGKELTLDTVAKMLNFSELTMFNSEEDNYRVEMWVRQKLKKCDTVGFAICNMIAKWQYSETSTSQNRRELPLDKLFKILDSKHNIIALINGEEDIWDIGKTELTEDADLIKAINNFDEKSGEITLNTDDSKTTQELAADYVQRLLEGLDN